MAGNDAPADKFSPDGTRRPYWMLRPLKPAREFYKLPEQYLIRLIVAVHSTK